MALSDRLSFRVINDLVHDITAGVFPGAVLALWLVRNGARATLAPEAVSSLAQSWSWIVLVLFVALVLFVVTGSIRVSYRLHNIRTEETAAQGRSALIKHVVFILVFVYAAVVAFSVIQP
jgi:putative copper export protein